MQGFITALGALCVLAFIALIAGCSGDACLGLPAVIGPVFVVSLFVFIAGVAIWRADSDAREVGSALKLITSMLGVALFVVGYILWLAFAGRP